MRRRSFYSPSGAGKGRQNVPEDVERGAQCRLAQVNRDLMPGGGGEGEAQVWRR